TFRDDGHALRDVPDKSDRRRVHSPAASDSGAGAGNLGFLRVPAGHAAALVTEIAGQRCSVAMKTGAFPAGAKMDVAIPDHEIPRIEQRLFFHVRISLEQEEMRGASGRTRQAKRLISTKLEAAILIAHTGSVALHDNRV